MVDTCKVCSQYGVSVPAVGNAVYDCYWSEDHWEFYGGSLPVCGACAAELTEGASPSYRIARPSQAWAALYS